KLRLRLAQESRRSLWKRFSEFKLASFVPLPLAAALILGVIALGLFWALHRGKTAIPNPGIYSSYEAKKDQPHPVPSVETPPNQNGKQSVVPPHKAVNKEFIAQTSKHVVPKPPKVSTDFDAKYQVVVPPYSGPLGALNEVVIAKHLEKDQLLLRSFRNPQAAHDDGVFDIAYEKTQSARLLNQNIVLRRQAEAKGNLPTEELLSSLEPFLIDIANLPDKPAKDDIHSIKERMQKREIVASLQVYSAQTAPPY